VPAATAPNAAERLVDYRPEQQNDCERRDRSNQAVRPEHLHVAAEPIMASRKASSARLPSTSASVNGASGMPIFLKI